MTARAPQSKPGSSTAAAGQPPRPQARRKASNCLEASHLADLRRSGLDDATIRRCQFRSTADATEVRELLGWQGYSGSLGSCLVIPYFHADGTVNEYVRLKPSQPRKQKEDGKPIKYEARKGSANRAYFPPGCTVAALADPTHRLLITEGEKKAAKADQEGFPCVGISGVWNWQQKREADANGRKGERKLIPDLEDITWDGRPVYVVFDSDRDSKPDVRLAEWELTKALAAKGAAVKVALLPARDDGVKVGLDDYLCQPDADLQALLDAAAGPQRTDQAPSWEQPIPLSEAPNAPPFPLDVLPRPLAHCAAEMAWAVNCPPDFVALPMLALAGGAVASSRQLALTRSHTQSASLYAATIGRPGSAKSPPLKLLRRPFDQAQRRAIHTHEQAMTVWEEAAKCERGEKPVLHRCVVGDITTESLGLTLNENPRGLLMIRDELAGLVAGMNQYKAGKGHDRQVYLALWAGETILIDRKSDRGRHGMPLSVYDPFVSIVGTIQPAVLDRLRGDGRDRLPPPDDGFLDRFLFAYPEDVPAAGEKWRELSEGAQQVWDNTVEALLGLAMVREDDDGQRPYLLHLTSEGRQSWERFTAAHAVELNAEEFPDYLRGAWSKLRGYCARLGLILCCLRNVGHERLKAKVQDVTGDDLGAATGSWNTSRATPARCITRWMRTAGSATPGACCNAWRATRT